jgi:leucyl aminopeptidase
MTLTLAATSPAATVCDALLIGISPAKGKSVDVHAHGLSAAQSRKLAEAFVSAGASGKAGEVTRIPAQAGIKAKTIVAVGLGEFRTMKGFESFRRSMGNAVRSLAGSKKIAIIATPDIPHLRPMALGAQLAAYSFTEHKGKSTGASPVPSIVLLVPGAVTPEQKALIAEINVVSASVFLARDLVNTPPNALPPIALAKAAKDSVAGLPVKVTTWDVAALKRDGCGGILGVGQGSSNPPRLVKLEYSPAGATKHLSLVGKGITFDTGGISIKPAAQMDEMKGDMGGAAAVIAAVKAIAELGLKVKVTGWVPTAENMPSGDAMRPGDVITMFDGTTVEVLNTDAEGRLILADALGMAVLEKPTLLIDAATLTGAQRVALGSRIAGVMANDDDARAQVCAAADAAGEEVWPMPLSEDFRPAFDSATADLANIGDRFGGMMGAGVFLQEFIPKGQPWVHIDIAGPSFNDKGAYGYTPKGGTGAAVRTFVQVARELAAQ